MPRGTLSLYQNKEPTFSQLTGIILKLLRLRIILVNFLEIGSLFRYKDMTRSSWHVLVTRLPVYLCPESAPNAGLTKRHLYERMAEYEHSKRKGVISPKFSAVREHCNDYGCKIPYSLIIKPKYTVS